MQLIPLVQVSAQTFSTILAGQLCVISIYCRQDRLYMDLSVAENPQDKKSATAKQTAPSGQERPAANIDICRGALCQNRAGIVLSDSKHFSGSLHFYDLEGDSHPQWQELHNGKNGRYMLLYLAKGEETPKKLRY